MNRLMTLLFITTVFVFAVQNENDLDNDLVPNSMDKCPNTPEAVFVTSDGCTKTINRIVYFDHASAKLNEEYYNTLKETSRLINELPGYKIEIKGHTDSTAGYHVNMVLSKKRANLIENILLKNGVDKKRITTSWYGETMPVATNVTEDGRSQNRRVNIILK